MTQNPCRGRCWAYHSAPTSYRKALDAVSLPLSRDKGCPSTTIQNFVSLNTPMARPCARAVPLAPLAGRPCRGPAGRIVGPCRRATGHIVAPPVRAPTHLCHDTTYCIMTKTGKWAVAHLVSPTHKFFFFFIFVSFCSSNWKTPKKYIYNFFFTSSSRTK